ncbi:MAG TPA: hypothetical protein VIZ66_09660 [Sphingomicrobium sp.]
MSSTMIIILSLAVIALVIGVILAAGNDRPRITTIETKRKREEDDDDA